MKLRSRIQVKVLTVSTALAALCGLYQNFDRVNIEVSPVNQAARSSHARELLGKLYKGSRAQFAEERSDLHLSIVAKISESLPTKYRWQSSKLAQTLIEESAFFDFDPVFVLAIIKTESGFNPLARGQFGEIGLMQIKPDTAEWIAKKEGLPWRGPSTLENPVENIRIGIAFMSHLRNSFQGVPNKYVSAYNMGATKLRRLYASDSKPREYTLRVMKNYKSLYLEMVAPRVSYIAGTNF